MSTFLKKNCLLVLFILFSLASGVANAQSFAAYMDLHDFGGTVTNANGMSGPDGQEPFGGVAFDGAGNMYGTTSGGGPNGGSGNVWEITASGVYIDLHDFGGTVTNANGTMGPDGADPQCNVAVDSQGNLFGTTSGGGPNPLSSGYSNGIVWEITKAGVYKDLHDFGGTVTNSNGMTGKDGFSPSSGVTFDSAGDMFGVTSLGGQNGDGIVWEITKSGAYLDLHDFAATSQDGNSPYGNVTIDTAGNIYGTSAYGGANSLGTVWELAKSGTCTTLHSFGGTVTIANGSSGPDGTNSNSGVTFDTAGNMYGTATAGGPNNSGVLWKISKSGTYQDLHDFGGTIVNSNGQNGPDGARPIAAVIFDKSGNILGTAAIGGPYDEGNGNNGAGVVWEFTKAGAYVDIFDIGGGGSNGFAVPAGITIDGTGNLFGTTYEGGNNYAGSIWEVEALALVKLVVSPTGVVGGSTSTGVVTLNGVAPSGGAVVNLSSSNSNAIVPATVTIPAGATTASFSIKTSPLSTSTPITISAKWGITTLAATLTVTPPSLSGLSVSPAIVAGGLSSTGTVQLNGPAPTGGTVVGLTSDNSDATVPASVTVVAGAKFGTFSIASTAVSTSVSATITGTLGTTSQSATLTISPVAVASVSLSPSTVTGGGASSGTVSLNGPAPAGGMVVVLSCSGTNTTVPASVTVASGAMTATFTVSTAAVTANTSSTITASGGGASTMAVLTITAVNTLTLSVNPGSVVGGSPTACTITLSSPAPTGGALVSLSSSSASATVPASMTVAAGSTTASFNVKTTPVPVTTSITVTGSYSGAVNPVSLIIKTPNLNGFSLSPTSVAGGLTATGTVTIGGAAAVGGYSVSLTSNSPAAIVPASVTIPAGATSSTFTVSTNPVAANIGATITATFGLAKTAVLTVASPVITGLSLNPSSIVGGNTSTGTVTLGSPAPTGGLPVTLTSSNPAATLPAAATVPAGATTATFIVSTVVVPDGTTSSISASSGGQTASATLTIAPLPIKLVLYPSTVTGGQTSTGTVTLGSAAPAGGVSVSLSSTSSSATAPASVTIAAGATTASFAIATTSVSANTTSTISASQVGSSTTATLTITAVNTLTLSDSPTSVVGGSPSVCTVTLGAPAPSGGAVVSLSSSNPSAVVPATVAIAAGATTANFNIKTVPVQSTVSVAVSGSYGGAVSSIALTINTPNISAVSVSPTSVIGGASSSGTVTIGGPAPSGGYAIALSSNSAAATVPTTVTVPAGSTSAAFAINSNPVSTSTIATITAAFGTSSKAASLTISAPAVIGVSLYPTTVTGGTASTGTVTLSGVAPSGGILVTLNSSNTSAATVPAVVTVTAGATSATFSITTLATRSDTTSSIGASAGGQSLSATLTITAVNTLTLSDLPSSVVGMTPSVCTVTLSAPAPTGGAVVALSSNSSSAMVPASITVAAGATSAAFNIKTNPVATSANVTVTGTYNGAVSSVSLLIKVPNITGLTLNPTSVVGGMSSTGTVTLGGAAPMGGYTITLASNSPDATVPAAVTVPAGATSVTFTVSTMSVSANVAATISAIFNASKKTATLVITP